MTDAVLNFILGNPRSGTSLLRLMLNAHPEVAAPPECGFAMWLHGRYAGRDLRDPAVVAAFAADVSAARKFETWGVSPEELRRALTGRGYDSYPQLAAAVYATYARRAGKRPRVFLDKNNFHVVAAGQLARAFPDARFVHIVRDGRDVACSYMDLAKRRIDSEYRPNLPCEIDAIAAEWRRNCTAADSLPQPRTLTVRYEDLIARPEPELARTCAFLGIGFHPRMLEFFRWSDEPEAFLQWKEKTAEPLDAGNSGRYRKVLRPDQIAAFEDLAGDVLKRFGYRLESDRGP